MADVVADVVKKDGRTTAEAQVMIDEYYKRLDALVSDADRQKAAPGIWAEIEAAHPK